MKSISILLTAIVVATLSYAQTSGGPDPYGYTWKSSLHPVNPPSFQWVDITSTGTLVTGLADDNVVGPFTGSSGFQFYWYTNNQFWIGSNGYIAFNAANISAGANFPQVIPDPAGANDYIGPMIADLNPDPAVAGQTAQVYYYSNADSLVVSFHNVPFWALGVNISGDNTFQIILDKNDYSITYNYLTMDVGVATSLAQYGMVGIENVSGTLGLSSLIHLLPADSSTIKYTYPAVVNYPVPDASVEWTDNELNGGIFVIEDGAGESFTANVKNSGNQTLNNIMVYDSIFTVTGNLVSNGSASITTLSPGQNMTVIFSDTFSAPNEASYILRSRVVAGGDIVSSNDFKEIEIVAVDTTQVNINLNYSNGTSTGSLSWNGGGGGIGVYFEPPIYPAKVKETSFYIAAVGSPPAGFYAIIYDDNGVNGGPGTVLDSVFVNPLQVFANQYSDVQPSSNLIIDSGGVYVYWGMGGAGIGLGQSNVAPIGRRSFESLNGSWSVYRDNDIDEFLVGLRIQYAYPFVRFNIDKSNDPTIAFIDNSTNNPTSWLWEFGDGATDTVQNPSHTYAENDTFNVCLTAGNQYGSGYLCKDVVTLGNVPTADFTIDANSAPLISFFDASTNNPIAWHWDFNVGPGDTSVLQNSAFNYKANGIYNVCLVATNVNGPSSPHCEEVEITGIGLKELQSIDMAIFPNPISSSATITIDANLGNQTNVRLIDLNGKEVFTRVEKEDNSFTIYKDNLRAGQYIIEISDGVSFVLRKSISFVD